MRSRSFVLVLCSGCALLFVVLGVGAAEDEGAKLYGEACTSCHSASVRPLDDTHLTREQWRQSIERMIPLGAEIPDNKVSVLLDYLVRTRGPLAASGSRPAPGSVPSAASAAAGGSPTASDPGAAIYQDFCTSCHSAKTRPLDDVRLTREQWKASIEKMIAMGTALSDDEVPVLLDYLVRTHGPTTAAK